MGFNSAFKGLKLLKTRERAFKQFKLSRPQYVKLSEVQTYHRVIWVYTGGVLQFSPGRILSHSSTFFFIVQSTNVPWLELVSALVSVSVSVFESTAGANTNIHLICSVSHMEGTNCLNPGIFL